MTRNVITTHCDVKIYEMVPNNLQSSIPAYGPITTRTPLRIIFVTLNGLNSLAQINALNQCTWPWLKGLLFPVFCKGKGKVIPVLFN
jgi:hypothetical protein